MEDEDNDIEWYFGSQASIPKNGSTASATSSKNAYLDVQTEESKTEKNAQKVDDTNGSSEYSTSEDDDSSAEDIVFDLQKLRREQIKLNLPNGSDTSNSSQLEDVPENGSNEQHIKHAVRNPLCPVKSAQRPSVHMLNYEKFKASTKYFSPPDSHIDDGSAWIPKVKRTRLPIESRRDDIINIIRENKVVVLSGSTGCGKRRIAATSLAHRVSSERGTKLRGQVGFHIGGKNGYSSSTRLLYVTTGILLEMLKADRYLKSYTHVIMDEATMNTKKFTEYFHEFEIEKDGIISKIPWIDVPAKNFPVDVFYLEDICQGLEVTEAHQTLIMSEPKKPAMMQERRDILIDWIMHCHATCSADEAFLVFLPGISVIAEVIILATNVAESSITVPDVRIIFDSCLRKDVYYDKATRCYSLNEQWISKDCAEQRRGRADPPDDTAVDYALEDLEATGAVTKSVPIIRETDDWVQGSITTYEYEVTRLGSILAQLPIDLHSGLLVVYGAIFGSLYDTMIIAGVIVQPPNQEIAISAAIKRFHLNLPSEYKLQGGSDLISHLRAYLFWEETTQNDSEFDRTNELNWCQQQFISLYWIREIQDLVITIRESLSYQNICSPPTKQERDKI
ncbi:381_t:CDS:2, partial [Racocetra fulgida]